MANNALKEKAAKAAFEQAQKDRYEAARHQMATALGQQLASYKPLQANGTWGTTTTYTMPSGYTTIPTTSYYPQQHVQARDIRLVSGRIAIVEFVDGDTAPEYDNLHQQLKIIALHNSLEEATSPEEKMLLMAQYIGDDSIMNMMAKHAE